MTYFVHVPRCGGTTIFLSGYDRYRGHLYAQSLVDAEGTEPQNIMGITRNPYERVISLAALYAGNMYISKKDSGRYASKLPYHVFRSFVKSLPTKERSVVRLSIGDKDYSADVRAPVSTWLNVDGYGIVPHIRHENYADDVKQHLGIDAPKRTNYSNMFGAWQEYYDQQSKDIVLRMYEPDFENFNYPDQF